MAKILRESYDSVFKMKWFCWPNNDITSFIITFKMSNMEFKSRVHMIKQEIVTIQIYKFICRCSQQKWT